MPNDRNNDYETAYYNAEEVRRQSAAGDPKKKKKKRKAIYKLIGMSFYKEIKM